MTTCNISNLFLVGIAALSIVANADQIDERNFKPEDIIEKDVAIIGGGATGTYAAVRLREDFNQTIIVVEQQNHLGGHVNTYIDPATGFPIDYGVEAYDSLPAALAFFQRFNISMVPEAAPPFTDYYVDLNTGVNLPGSPPNYTQALETYAEIVTTKYAYLAIGYGQIPDPLPAELLEPFGQFIETYNLGALVPIIWTFAFGVGNLTAATTLDVLQNFGPVQLNDLVGNSFLIPSSHDNSILYQEAAALLGSDVLYDSVVTESYRSDKGPQLVVVQTSTGCKLVKANKLLVTIPTTLENMAAFDMDDQEASVFKQWQWQINYVAVLSNTGLPDDIEVINADPTTLYGLPQLPFVWHYDFSGDPGHFTATVLGDDHLSADDAKKLILGDLANLGRTHLFNITTNPQIDAFAAHVPLQLHVDADAIKNGFYKDLYALQGYRSTFYTGAGWAGDYSSVLWQFTEGILPEIIA